MRCATRAWPERDGCLARESASRRARRGSVMAAAAASPKYSVVSSMAHSYTPSTLHGDDDDMTKTLRAIFDLVFGQEDLNFLLTNRIPRRLATHVAGWFSRIEQPLVRDLSIGLWRTFADLELHEAKRARFRSLHDCFIRELRDGARTIDADPAILVSPCDAIVGASGAIEGTRVWQAKGFPYALAELLGETGMAETYRDGCY